MTAVVGRANVATVMSHRRTSTSVAASVAVVWGENLQQHFMISTVPLSELPTEDLEYVLDKMKTGTWRSDELAWSLDGVGLVKIGDYVKLVSGERAQIICAIDDNLAPVVRSDDGREYVINLWSSVDGRRLG